MDTPSQTGVAERTNRHLPEAVRALLFEMPIPRHFSIDVMSTRCFLLSGMPSTVLSHYTPFHVLFPHKTLFSIGPRIFGCTCFVRGMFILKLQNLILNMRSQSVSFLISPRRERVLVLSFGTQLFSPHFLSLHLLVMGRIVIVIFSHILPHHLNFSWTGGHLFLYLYWVQ